MALKSYFDSAVPLALPDRWISTGVHSIDYLLGRGMPRGSILQLYGESQSRKSTISTIMMAAAQKAGCAVAVWDPEVGFLEHVALLVGVDLDPPEFELEANHYGIFGPKHQKILSPGFLYDSEDDQMESVFQNIMRFIRCAANSGITPFIVVDSASRLSTKQEKKKGIQGETMMQQSKVLRKCLRLVMRDLKKSGGIMILIDHLKPTGGAGAGSATGFFATNRVSTTYDEPILDSKEDIIGFVSKLEATKSRYCGGGIEFPLNFIYGEGGGVDVAGDIFWVAQMTGLITRGGAWFTLNGIPHPDKKKKKEGKDLNFQGADKWHQVFQDNKKLILEKWLPEGLEKYYVDKWNSYCKLGGKDPKKQLAKYKVANVISGNVFDPDEEVIIE